MGSDDHLLGWNPDGIWLRTGSTTSVRRPGSTPRPVPGAGLLRIDRHTRRMVDLAARGCVAVAELRPAGLTRLWRRCRNGGYDDAVLSPDGRYVALPDGEVAPVDGGAARRAIPLDGPGSAVWEDGTHLLVRTSSGADGWLRMIVVRCDVTASSCERAYDRRINRPGVVPWLTLAQP